MVESKELFFLLKCTSKNNIYEKRYFFSRDCSFRNNFALHKKSKNYGTRFIKMLLFQKLRVAVNFEGIFQVIFHHVYIPVGMAKLTVAYDRPLGLSNVYWLQ
jgi:hypothetical protein